MHLNRENHCEGVSFDHRPAQEYNAWNFIRYRTLDLRVPCQTHQPLDHHASIIIKLTATLRSNAVRLQKRAKTISKLCCSGLVEEIQLRQECQNSCQRPVFWCWARRSFRTSRTKRSWKDNLSQHGNRGPSTNKRKGSVLLWFRSVYRHKTCLYNYCATVSRPQVTKAYRDTVWMLTRSFSSEKLQ